MNPNQTSIENIVPTQSNINTVLGDSVPEKATDKSATRFHFEPLKCTNILLSDLASLNANGDITAQDVISLGKAAKKFTASQVALDPSSSGIDNAIGALLT